MTLCRLEIVYASGRVETTMALTREQALKIERKCKALPTVAAIRMVPVVRRGR